MSLLRLIRRYKQFDFTGFVPIVVPHDGHSVRIGWTKEDVAKGLAGLGDVFMLANNQLTLHPVYDTYAKRTEAVDVVLLKASEQGVLPPKIDYSATGGDDWFTVAPQRQTVLFEMRRFYTPFVGVRRYASRVNAFYDDQMWIVKRGTGVHQYPGFLDNLVGAGQIAGRTILENTIVEAHEEAGLTPQDCAGLVSTSMIHTFRHTPKGFLFDENIYIYDLDTNGVIMPQIVNTWETADIMLWSYDQVIHTMKNTDEFRPEAALCLIDFFIRRGVITPDNEPDYDEICFGLRSLLPTTRLATVLKDAA